MHEGLDHLTEADIQARCSQTSFERGRGYYTGGAVRGRVRLDYDFAAAYRDLALDPLEEHANAIESEVRDILRGDWAPEMLGIDEPLMEVWAALGL